MFVKAVRAHAEKNYDRDGWDFIVECWEDADIQEWTADCKTEEEAIRAVGSVARALADQRSEVQSTVW